MFEMRCNTDFSGSCHDIDTDVGITWCHQHCQRNHGILYIRTIEMRSNVTFLLMWHSCHWYHMMPLVLVSHEAIGISVNVTWCLQHHKWHRYIFQVKMTEVRCSMTFLVIWCHWHWHQHHVIQTVLLMAPLHSLGPDDQNEVQHYFFGHVTQLAPASPGHDADGIVNGTITFLMSRWSKWSKKWLFFSHLMSLVQVSVSLIANDCTAFLRSLW